MKLRRDSPIRVHTTGCFSNDSETLNTSTQEFDGKNCVTMLDFCFLTPEWDYWLIIVIICK